MSKFIRYGDRTMPLDDGMTLEQAKELMARHFPELADPKVDTKNEGDKTTYTFSKKAGHKGAVNNRPNAGAIEALQKLSAIPVVYNEVVVCVKKDWAGGFERDLARESLDEAEETKRIIAALENVPSSAQRTGSVL